MSIKIAECAIKEKSPCDYLVLALTEKQAYNLFFKTLMYLESEHPREIKRGNDKPTKHEIQLKNGVTIMCYAAGLTGEGIRTFTIKKLFIDEAAPMSREVFISVMPMLSVTGGTMDVASTPRGKAGFFYECSLRDDFKKFYVSAEDCPRHPKEFLESQKKTMSHLEYAQEYLAQFLDELKRVFSDDWLKNVCILEKRKEIIQNENYYLGADIAGMGSDETAITILDRIIRDKKIEQVESEVLNRKDTTEITQRILEFNASYKLKMIGIDDGGVGFGVWSELIKNPKTKGKTFALNNASRQTDGEGEKSKKLLKVEMYLNLLNLGEQNIIKLLKDDELINSLKSVQYEYLQIENRPSVFTIFGNDTHKVEGVIRATWLATQDKSLKLFVHSF